MTSPQRPADIVGDDVRRPCAGECVYCSDALYGERRDRSILFWKSMLVSDLTTVLESDYSSRHVARMLGDHSSRAVDHAAAGLLAVLLASGLSACRFYGRSRRHPYVTAAVDTFTALTAVAPRCFCCCWFGWGGQHCCGGAAGDRDWRPGSDCFPYSGIFSPRWWGTPD